MGENGLIYREFCSNKLMLLIVYFNLSFKSREMMEERTKIKLNTIFIFWNPIINKYHY